MFLFSNIMEVGLIFISVTNLLVVLCIVNNVNLFLIALLYFRTVRGLYVNIRDIQGGSWLF